MLWPQWRFGSDQLPLIPWRSGTVLRKAYFILRHGSYSSVTENRELARQHARRRKKHVSFQRLAVVRGSSPVLGPPVLTHSRSHQTRHVPACAPIATNSPDCASAPNSKPSGRERSAPTTQTRRAIKKPCVASASSALKRILPSHCGLKMSAIVTGRRSPTQQVPIGCCAMMWVRLVRSGDNPCNVRAARPTFPKAASSA